MPKNFVVSKKKLYLCICVGAPFGLRGVFLGYLGFIIKG